MSAKGTAAHDTDFEWVSLHDKGEDGSTKERETKQRTIIYRSQHSRDRKHSLYWSLVTLMSLKCHIQISSRISVGFHRDYDHVRTGGGQVQERHYWIDAVDYPWVLKVPQTDSWRAEPSVRRSTFKRSSKNSPRVELSVSLVQPLWVHISRANSVWWPDSRLMHTKQSD